MSTVVLAHVNGLPLEELLSLASLALAGIARADLIDVEQRLEQIAVRRDAAYRGAAETGAVIAAVAGDEARARAGAGELVISERDFDPGHGEQPTAVGGAIMHALGAIDQPRTALDCAIGGEGEPMG